MAATHRFIATSAFGTEDALVRELRTLGIHRTKPGKGHVRFSGDLRAGYTACLWSRVASRVFLVIAQFEAMDADTLYQGLLDTDWRVHMRSKGTLWIDFVGGSRQIRDERFGAQRTKDAICDQFRTFTGNRPSISQHAPDLRLRVHLRDGLVTVSVDLSGQPLHMRSPSRATGRAPLRETLAAAVLWYADWPKRAMRGEALVDPMCGSGTFLKEAAGMALDLAPGLARTHWGFDRWSGHDRALWAALRKEAEDRRAAKRQSMPVLKVVGSDIDGRAIQAATRNLEAAGWAGDVDLTTCSVSNARPPDGAPGLVVVNPPYGQRLEDDTQAQQIHRMLGDSMRHHFLGWTVAVITEHPLVGCVGLKPHRRIPIRNGALDCRLAMFDIAESAPTQRSPESSK